MGHVTHLHERGRACGGAGVVDVSHVSAGLHTLTAVPVVPLRVLEERAQQGQPPHQPLQQVCLYVSASASVSMCVYASVCTFFVVSVSAPASAPVPVPVPVPAPAPAPVPVPIPVPVCLPMSMQTSVFA